MEQTAIIGDVHIPYHDPPALKCALKITKDLKPDRVILIGDIIDFYSISRYMKDPGRINSLQPDIDKTRAMIDHIRTDIAPNAEIIYLEGNHEDRLGRFLLTKAPELYNLRALTVPELLDLRKMDITYKIEHQIGDLTLTHGHIVRKHSAYTARAMSEDYGCVISGHTHRLGSHYRTDRRGHVCAYENGCLASMGDVEFIKGTPNWQHGFSVLSENRGLLNVEQIQIHDGQAIFRGHKWSA